MDHLEFNIERLGECQIPSPVKRANFIPEYSGVAFNSDISRVMEYVDAGKTPPAFEQAGPRETIFHDPAWSKAAILTAGGLCPGLNDVIKGLTRTLKLHYKVPVVYGIRYGYRGLIPDFNLKPMLLDEENVDDLHEHGGTKLGSSRGRQDEERMVDTLVRMNINILFCIGGDGTLRCAHDIVKVIKKRKLSISVVCIPKTIDNDIGFIDKSFGFETAVYATNSVITAAHNEAKGAFNGIGLIKVMGRDSGFIAAFATLANTHVNYCLIPEEEFALEGSGSLLDGLKARLKEKDHAVIIVAEGAGQEFFEESLHKTDASGNKLHEDIGLLLRDNIHDYFKRENVEINLKYFDPSYMIRSLQANGTDAVFCLMLAQNAVHAAMSGCSDIVVGHWHDHFTLVPIPLATKKRKKIAPNSPLWNSVKAVTSF
ncbi:MAG: ATP-dependent 6-phosphofructokinase [Lentisphaerae bacterium]|nr:ATP-dependent 6-phosphofructokinase [Lentisphaerota bacterium]MCP4102265.1 ATP-dependent 6-phosphofructokinase [Lentisphaerota bacterium]